MLIKHAKKNKWNIIAIFCDEDYSRVDNERPEYNKCLRFCEVGKTDISDNIRDTIRNKHISGQFTGPFAPYGYIKDLEDKNHLLLDPIASVVVKKIFELYTQKGYGIHKIITYLNEENIPCPYEYKLSQGLNCKYKKTTKERVWGRTTIARILSNVVYIGNLAQSKTTTPDYKNKTIVYLPKEQCIVYENSHELIIDKEVFEKAQEIKKNKARACKGHGIKNKYSGLIECDCCHRNFKKTSGRARNGEILGILNVLMYLCQFTSVLIQKQ